MLVNCIHLCEKVAWRFWFWLASIFVISSFFLYDNNMTSASFYLFIWVLWNFLCCSRSNRIKMKWRYNFVSRRRYCLASCVKKSKGVTVVRCHCIFLLVFRYFLSRRLHKIVAFVTLALSFLGLLILFFWFNKSFLLVFCRYEHKIWGCSCLYLFWILILSNISFGNKGRK